MNSRIIGGVAISHAPSMVTAYDPAHRFYRACEAVRDWLAKAAPDAIVMFASDHLETLNDFQFPTLAIGVGDKFPQLEQDHPETANQKTAEMGTVRGEPELARKLAELLVEAEFDLALCQDLEVDHGIVNGLAAITPSNCTIPVVPILINSYLAPLPTPRRCFRLGNAVKVAVESLQAGSRVLIVATGGLSHNLSGPAFGFVNPDWDRRFLRLLCDDPDMLASLSNQEFAERGGDSGLESRAWLAMRGALSPQAKCLQQEYFVPSICGLGVLALENPS